MITPQNWKEYELLDTGDGMKLENWNGFVLARPDPQALWPRTLPDFKWEEADATYIRSKTGGGKWHFRRQLPEMWTLPYVSSVSGISNPLIFEVRPTGFKHTGLFPEQAANWEWMMDSIKKTNRPISVLNLFAYTGGATVACAAAGASVTHVDSAKGMCEWAGENLELSSLRDKPVRFIVDDVIKFVEREIRRGTKYDAIIMDPPSYGRGSDKETWKIEKMLYPLVESCAKLLSDMPLFFLINSYTTGMSPTVLENVLASALSRCHLDSLKISSGEIGLTQTSNNRVLPAGIFGKWVAK